MFYSKLIHFVVAVILFAASSASFAQVYESGSWSTSSGSYSSYEGGYKSSYEGGYTSSYEGGYKSSYDSWNTSPVSPVPEPSTYVMLLVGLGLISFQARRRA